MKNTGIWMDKQQAHLVSLETGEPEVRTVASDVEFFNPKGGSRSKTRWGPQQVVQDSKYTEREKHQMHEYFEDVAGRLDDSDALVLYGPAGTNERFKSFLDEKHPQLAARVRDVLTADSMTMNQMVALIRDYYKS